MSSFGKFRCAFGKVPSAALTTEFAMQTRQPQSSFSLETARRRNITCAQTMLISKLFILLEPEELENVEFWKNSTLRLNSLNALALLKINASLHNLKLAYWSMRVPYINTPTFKTDTLFSCRILKNL